MVNNQKKDAAAFNAQDRERTDNNWELTALAQPLRALYLVGDGNGYFGYINLKPEQVHTVSATLDLHAADRRWEELRITPYYTRVTDYIDAIRCPVGASCAPANRTTTNQFVVLQYANQSAELYGLDASARMPLARQALATSALLACSPTLTARTATPATTSTTSSRSIASSRWVAEKARSRLRRKTTCPTCATKPRQRVTG
jgi:outer membrane cobalamin receptor